MGPNREIYITNGEHTPDPAAWVTEIQFPVFKAQGNANHPEDRRAALGVVPY